MILTRHETWTNNWTWQSWQEKQNNFKNFDGDTMSANCDVIVIFPIYGQLEPNSGRLVCKTYILIESSFLSNKNWKKK